LHITGRRADGYHRLQTIFRAVNLYDEIALTQTDGTAITRSVGPKQVSMSDDLTVRAAKLLQAHANFEGGVDIALHKNIPMGAGMGGGSSDAAGVLIGLNQLWGLHLPIAILSELALQLGADVPFFLRGGDQWGEGIGDVLTPVALPRTDYVIVHPGLHCDTTSLFTHPDLPRDMALLSAEQVLAGAPTCNAFEAIVVSLYPEIAAAREWLIAHAGNARLTGSGSALFATVTEQKIARKIKADCPAPWQAWFARSLGN
jgi:4-diphosphocytidyl-2-C-methyl-D-erythritol kinase